MNKSGQCKFGKGCTNPKCLNEHKCKFFETGVCKFGASCMYKHEVVQKDEAKPTQPISSFSAVVEETKSEFTIVQPNQRASAINVKSLTDPSVIKALI